MTGEAGYGLAGLNFYALLNSTDVPDEDAYTLFDSRIVKKGGVINKDGRRKPMVPFSKAVWYYKIQLEKKQTP